MRKLVVWGATAYRQRLDGRVKIAVSEDGFHDLMLDSFRLGQKYLPLAWKNRELLKFHIGKPLMKSLRGEFSDFTTHRSLDPSPDLKGLESAKAAFLNEYPAAGQITYEKAWAGYIDYLPDELPVIDMLGQPSGLVIAAGLCGNGFAIGPGVGQVVSDLITKGESRHDLTAFSASRFQ
jgi:glycine/D-amino acid oxidase-like deaminating enzyme